MFIRQIRQSVQSSFLDALVDLPNSKISFSQSGEDVILNHCLSEINDCRDAFFYVDIGCFHPITFNNSFFLSMSGWRGINVDPQPLSIAAFRMMRPNDINIVGAISDKSEIRAFYEVDSGTSPVSSFMPLPPELPHSIRMVQCWTLDDLLAQHLPDGQQIGFLDLDVEGLDQAIFDRFSVERYLPRIIAIELFDRGQGDFIEFPVHIRLIGLGYRLVARMISTNIYCLAVVR